MVEDARSDVAATSYRGFLFSDVRGFTAFAERRGNAAAAEMVARFLAIARQAIARCGGVEMSTEGDAIHAVFESASNAVLCGLEIVEAAAEATSGIRTGRFGSASVSTPARRSRPPRATSAGPSTSPPACALPPNPVRSS